MKGPKTFSLLFAPGLIAIALTACAPGDAAKPDLPASVSPGWQLKGVVTTPTPPELAASGAPSGCWKATYSSNGQAELTFCGYTASSGAFDAAQRVPTTGTQVKFQKGRYFVLAKWTGADRAAITALLTAVQKVLPDEK